MVSLIRPADFNPKFEAVNCFLQLNGKILLLQRKEEKPLSKISVSIFGKIENGELEYSAVIRKVKEDLGIELDFEKLNFYKSIYVRNSDSDFICHIYSADFDELPLLTLNTEEYSDYILVTPQEALQEKISKNTAAYIKIFYGI